MPETDPCPDAAARRVAAALRPFFEGRRFLHYGGAPSHLVADAAEYARLGAEMPFLLPDFDDGAPPPPPEAGARAVVPVPAPGRDMVEHLRVLDRALDVLPADVHAAVARWDPDGVARSLPRIALHSRSTVAGRRTYGLRAAAWWEAEDKTRVDALFDAAGVARPPSAVVAADDGAALRAAAARLDRGGGTVWAPDAAEGLTGGAIGLRRVRGADEAALAAEAMRGGGRGRRVRVVPFLEGIPCSVHGIVFPGGTVALRPVEILCFRRTDGPGFVYGGCADGWDPPAADREVMRVAAERTGAALAARLGFRGAFTLDGVLAEEGFLPTEVNARPGASLGLYARALPGFPVWPLVAAVAEGEDLPPWLPDVVRHALVAAADAARAGWLALTVEGGASPTPRTAFVEEVPTAAGTVWRAAAGGGPGTSRVSVAPSAWGAIVRFAPAKGSLPVGPSAAPWALAAIRAGAAALGVSLPALEPARTVR